MADSGYLTPMLLLTGVSYANHLYNTGDPKDVKILVMGGIATGILALFSNVKGFAPVATQLGWVAFIAVTISPVQKPSPVQNLLKITGQ